jgi:hypothetical protein
MSSNIEFKSDGTVHVTRDDGYVYVVVHGLATWRYPVGHQSSVELIPYETGLRKPSPAPSAPMATPDQLFAHQQEQLAVRKLGLLARLIKARRLQQTATGASFLV